MALVIRDAGPEDAAAIAAIHNPLIAGTTVTWRSAPTDTADRAGWIAGRQAAGFPVLVAEGPGPHGLAGYASYGPYRSGDGYSLTVEHSIHLAPEAQGMGLGRALMGVLVDRARAQGLHAIVGGLSADNAASRAFHQGLGFELCGVQPQVGHKFGRWLDLEIWVLRLDDRAAP